MTDTCAGPLPVYHSGMFFLTRRESIVIILVMLAFVAGAGIRHWRQTAPLAALHSPDRP